MVLVRDGTEVASWRLDASDRPDLALADALARWQLTARRMGGSILLCGASDSLVQLLEFLGLAEVLNRGDDALRQAGGEAEHREQRGVDEVVVPDDPVA